MDGKDNYAFENARRANEDAGWERKIDDRHKVLPVPSGGVPRIEADPTGKSQHEAGAKVDAGKATYDLVLPSFPKALAAVDAVAKFGAAKYTRDGWRSVPDAVARYGNAGQRHRIARLGGESHDPDSKLLHAAHDAWNALAVLELLLTQTAA
jgi:hypothetical protein